MTPAERLLAAADLLEKRADDALAQIRGYGPGDYYWGGSYGAIQRDGMGGEIGEFAATMHPEVGKALAELLRSVARDPAPHKWDVARLTQASALAELLLAGTS